MGTNFYMLTRNKSLAEKYAPFSYELTDTPYFAYRIHVAKISSGWLPLFQSHDDGIQSVKEYLVAAKQPEIEIYDEYDRKYTVEEFISRVLYWYDGECLEASNIRSYSNKYFKDPDGYEFSSDEFD